MDNQFGRWLLRQIERRDMTRGEFAHAVAKSPARVSEWVNGKRIPDPVSCDLIADALGVDLDLVLWQAGHRPRTEPTDPDDPKLVLHGMIDRIDWKADPGNFRLASRILQTMLEEQKARHTP